MSGGLSRVERVLENQMDENFRDSNGITEIHFVEEDLDYGFTAERSKLFIDTESVDREHLDMHAATWAEAIGDKNLQHLFRRQVDKLADALDTEVTSYLKAHFAPIGSGSSISTAPADYNMFSKTMRYSRGMMDTIVPGNSPEIDWPETAQNIQHEAAHGVQGEEIRFRTLNRYVSDRTLTQREFTENPDRAGVEALAVFEEDSQGELSKKGRRLEEHLGDEWMIPEVLRKRMDGGAGYKMSDHLYSGPYDMAEVIAYTVKNHFKKEGSEDPVNETREILFELAPEAEEWERALSGIWKHHDIPDYHRLFEENYRKIQQNQRYAKKEFSRLETELREQEEPDIELYYEAKSFLHAYNETGREIPDHYNVIQDMATDMAVQEFKSRVEDIKADPI